MCKTYDCDTLGYCPFDDEFNSSMASCREHCGLGVDEDAPEGWEDDFEDGDVPFEVDDSVFEEEIDESMNPYDGTYEWQMEGNGFFDE